MGVTVHSEMRAGVIEQVQKVFSASTGAYPTDSVGHPKPGQAVITYDGGVGAYTLADPVAGMPSPPSGSAASLGTSGPQGNDGEVVTIVCTTAHAHTVTTASANKINGAYNTITFAAVGDIIVLRAYGGVWYVDVDSTSCTLSAV
jgi:hypothetical protein